MTKSVEVTQTVKITVDETKFTPEFMAEFREQFYDFQTLDDHLMHLAQLAARGLIQPWVTKFVEGYGDLAAMGIKIDEPELTDAEVID